jgi:regulator of replication initiation timing
VDVKDQRLFPISDRTAGDALKEAVDAGIEGGDQKCEATGRSLIHNHGFRKFFQTRFTGAMEGGRDIANILAGHGNVIDTTYTHKTREEMGQYYLRAEHKLLVETPKEIIEKTEKATKETNVMKGELDTMKTNVITNMTTVQNLMMENTTLKAQMAAQNEMITKIAARLEEYSGYFQERHTEALIQIADKEVEEFNKKPAKK